MFARRVSLTKVTFQALVADPAVKRGGCDDRDEYLNGLSQGLPERQQPLTLARLRVDLTGQAAPEDFVLLFQKLDLPGELTISGRGDEGEYHMENLGHGGMVVNGYRETSFHIRCTPLDPPKTYSVPVQTW